MTSDVLNGLASLARSLCGFGKGRGVGLMPGDDVEISEN